MHLAIARRHYRMIALSALMALACAQPTSAQTTKLKVSVNNFIDSAAFEAARAKGYFAEEGLEIDSTVAVGGAVGLPALVAGQYQIATSNLISIVLGVKNGLPFRIIGAGDATFDTPPDLAGMAAKLGSRIKSGKDLEGKRVAVNTRNNIIWLFARGWINATGGIADKVTYLEVPFPQMADALAHDRVDAAFIVEPFLSAGLGNKTIEVIGWPYSQVQKNIPISQWVTTQNYIDENPQIIEKFVRAYNRGTDWVNQNKGTDEFYSLVSAYTRISAENVKRANAPAFIKTLDPANVTTTIELMRKHGMLDASDKIDAATLIHPLIRGK